MYHVVASDLDGTLLSPDHRLTPYTKETLRLLTARGVHFVFATGRHHVDVSQMRDNLEIEAYMITSNGARVHNTAGELIFSHNLDEDIARELYALKYDDPDILTNVYRDDEWFLNRHRPEEERYFRESIFTYQVYEPGGKVGAVRRSHPGALGRSGQRQLLFPDLPGGNGRRRVKRPRAGRSF